MKQNLLQSIFTAHEKSASIARKLGLLSILVIAATLLGSNVFAQTYTKITNVSGTTSYGAVSVTTTTSGYSNSPFCGGQADPFRSSGSFDVITFTFSSPISSIQLACQFGGGSGTSFFSYSVNGSPYSLSPAELIGAPSDGCYGGLLSVSGGVLTNSGNNAQLGGLVQINGTINSISITHNGNSASWLGAFFAPLVLNFDNGTTQNTKVCQNASATSINSLLTATGTFGTTFTWSVVSGPSHGALGGFPATASVGTSVSPTGTTYTPTTGYSGPDAYTIQVSDGTNTTNTTINVNVQAPPASITGNAIICGTGNTTTLSDAVTGGTWTSGTTAVATVGTSSGVVTSVATGTTIITYSTGCGSDVTQTVTVGAFPAAISGTATACPGTTATLTDATAFGAWSSSTSSVATVGSSTGIVTGVAAGTTTITYTLNTGCAVNKTFTVNATPAAITGGGGLLCVTNTMTLSDATSGGAWSSSNTAVATVSGGTVTGVSGGTTTITYTSASGCISTLAVSVTALPTVSGGSNVAICAGTGTTLTGSGAVLYTWSPATGLSSTAGTSVTASPTVTTTYTVTGSNATSATVPFSYTGSIVSYTVPAGVTSITIAASGAQGGSQTTTSAPGGAGANMSGVFSVTPGDVLKVLTGEQPAAVQHTGGGGGGSFVWNVTTGNTLLIAAGGGGGAGYDGNTNNGVNGINAVTTNNGTDGGGFAGGGGVSGNGGTTPSAFYYAAGGTGWFSAGAGGYGGGCSNSTGGSTPLTGGAGGVYGGTAGVNGNGGFGGGGGGQGICSWVGGGGGGGYSGGAGGDFPSNLAYPGGGGGSYNAGTSQSNSVGNTGNGIVTISYAIPGCQNTATVTVTVNPLPSAISGASSVCKSSTTTLTDATAFGAWSSSNTAVATIGSATGVASGVATGSTTITYTLPTGCYATTALTVNPLPVAITGTGVVCVGLTATLSNGTLGGAWTSSNTSLATIVSGTGVMTGVLAGNPIITYTTASGCTTTTVATVNPLPAAITGTMNVCVGLTTALTDATAGGTWTTSTSSVATVNSSTGAVFGVAAGTTTITYTISTGCINTAVVTVNPNPAAISGTPVVCAGLTTTLTDATAGGNWGSSNLTVASIGTTSGIMTGFAAGTTTITYMLPTGCIAIVTGTVNTLPAAISGTTNVCAGLTTALTDALTGGTWSSSTSSVATVGSSSGIVSGVAAGTTTITYKLPTGCINTVVVTVNPLPASITGTQVVCEAATTTLANATGFGAWSTANTTASVNSVSGVVTGVAAGTATVTYTLTTGCIATAIVTINPTPAITAGTGIVCVGLTTTLTGSGFGNWSSSNTAVATVGSGTGIVTGVSAGYPNISYTLATGCFATKVATVNPLPTAIIGTMSSCIGATSALSDATAGGVWTTSVSSVATVGSSSGIVSGVTAGTTTISYTLSATGCAMTGIFTVNPFPSAITGTMNTCPGATTALADASTFGNWSSSNTSVATIGSGTGIVSGVAAGTTTITYTLSTGCSITAALTVNPLPSAISGTMTVCAGLTTGLSDAGGGTWSTNNTTVATVNSVSGIVSGVSAGTTTITYTLGTGCQSMAAVTVYALPAPISGTLNVCAGLTTGLSDVTGSGTWTSSTSSVATVGSATGLVNGLVAGTSTITYMIPTGCISTATVTVNPLPAAIGGTTNVCVGLTTALTDATLSGAWSSSVTSVATVVSGSGVVTGVLAGTTTITYTLGTGCIMTTQLTVNPLPAAISGSATVCAGLTTTFSDGSTGGAWTSGNTSAATVNSLTGAVFGVAAGTSTITYTLPTGCINTKVITVNPLPANIAGITSVCIGLTTTLSDATGTGTWSSSDATLAPVGASTGIVSGLSVGTPTITYMLATGCIATTIVTVNPLPAAITGTMNVCVGSFTILSDATPSGVWSSSNTTVAPVVGGIVIGATAGTTTITYTLPTGCINTAVVTVNPLPAAISGTTNVCVGSTTALADASPFGTWSSSNSSIATVVAPTGVVSGLLAGTTTITYTLNTGCLITTPVTVNPLPSSITGTFTVCAGLSTALTDVGGGTWSSGNTTVATVTGLGIVNGLLAGTTTITYTLPTGCTAMATVTVNPLPASITGLNTVCNGLSINMSDATAGGTWSSSNSTVAVINSLTGGLTGNTAGTTTITYALTATGCINTTVVTVNPLPAAIAGTTNVCVGLTTTLSDATPSGTWASSNLSVATVGTSSGIVTGFAAGTATVTYALTTTGCIMTTPVTVNPLPSAITGTMNVCAGLSTQLTDAGGGTWSSSNTAIATVNVLGLVNGVLAGTATITYTLPTGCITTTIVTVNPLPSPIGGLNNVCFGLTTSLNDPTPFGLWSSSNTTVATIGSGTGLVSGLTVGSTTITYQLSTGCISTLAFTVNPLPTSILGNGAVCLGLTTTLSDATPLGAWSSSNTTVATIGSTSGVMSGMAVGTTTITYTLPTTCMITMTGTVNPLPAAITGATTHVCQGLSITMSDATTPGVWSSSNTGIATVNSSTGVVNGIAPGTMTLTYTLPTSCIMTTVITVDPLPATITGTMSVCAGLTTTLSDATPSGTWSSSNTAVATVAGNVVTGVVAGTATITYTLPTGCIMTAVVTVNPLPATITGTTSVCAGLTTTLSDATALGTWSSSNTTIATIGSGTGLVNGLTAGTATMTYKLTATGCIMTTSVTVNPLPASITGTMNVCAGLTTALSDITPSGVWSSSNTAVATAGSSTGVVTGVAAGTATITYTIPTGCIMTSVVTVNPLPASITGTMAVCAGLTTTLSDATPSGTWSSSNTAVATIAGNVVTGISAGTTTITYTLPTGCIMTAIVLVNPLPAPISGTLNVCAGLTTTLSDVDAGGTFTNDMTVLVTPLTITPGGVITGITAGTNIITYTLATGCITTSVATVNPLPLGIIGNSHVCAGLTISMSDATPGGSWTSSNANATIDISTGVVNGVTAGTSIITYMLPTGCIMTRVITVDPLPTAISGTLNVCAGLTTALSNGSTGGMWTVGSSTIATVNSSTGVVTGVMAGTTTITYTLPTGCIMTDMVTVNPLPATITGTTQVCVGLTTPLGTTTLGGSWSSSNTAIATVDASLGEVTGVLAGTAIITYTLPTGCIMTSVVTVNPLPGTISGTLKVCAGSMTTLTNTGGGSWTSSNMSVATVSGGVVSGIMYGTSTITYTLPTGCITTAVASVDSLPTVFAVTGGGSFCPMGLGVHVLLSGSVATFTYQLYNGTTPIGSSPTIGTGLALDFGTQTIPGVYTVVAKDPLTSCTSNMTSTATVSLYPLPTPHTVSGGGSYCAGDTGVHVGLTLADGGVKYQLYVGGVATGSTINGAGTPLDFGLKTVADTYTVVATDLTTTCTNMMIGKATVKINALLTPSVTVSYPYHDTICAGTPITFTATPVNGGTAPTYVWQVNGVNKGTTNSYTYVPANADKVAAILKSNAVCPSPDTAIGSVIMPIIPISSPVVTISSDHGDTVCGGNLITYTATTKFGGSAEKLTWVLNGTAVDSGATYSYIPKQGDIIYNTMFSNYRCRDTNRVFSNNIFMTVDSVIIPSVTVMADPGANIATGTKVTFTAVAVDGGDAPLYQWYVNKVAVSGATTTVFTKSNLSNLDSVSVMVQRTDACGKATFNGIKMHVGGVSVLQVSASAIDINVLPNPNKGEFMVKGSFGVSDDVAVTLELTNMLGQVVYKNNVTAQGGNIEERIKISNTLANGMYLLNVRSEAASKVFHVVIEQ